METRPGHPGAFAAALALLFFAAWASAAPAAAPDFSLQPGSFRSSVTVGISCATRGAVIRFTTDTTAPTAASPAYVLPIPIRETTTLKARAFKSGMAGSEVTTGTYTIDPTIPLANGVPVHGISGPADGERRYRIRVPGGQTHLRFLLSGHSGEVDLFVRRGAPPTPEVFDRRSRTAAGGEVVVVPDPEAAEWNLLLRGETGFAGGTLRARYFIAEPAAAPVLEPPPGAYSSAVAVALSCPTERATIRFTTDGTEPTEGSPRHEGPIGLKATTVLRARAFRAGRRASPITGGTYRIGTPGPDDPLYPDLVVWKKAGVYLLDARIGAAGDLRLSNAAANIGKGPLHVFGSVGPDGTETARQRVWRRDGSHEDRIAGNFVFDDHPDHRHLHLRDFAVYNLRAVAPGGGPGPVVATSGKVTFALMDVAPFDLSLQGAPRGAAYQGGGNTQGISVGWADVYGSGLSGQSISLAAIRSGTYWLESTVDPENRLLESDDSNNTARARIEIDKEAATVRVVEP